MKITKQLLKELVIDDILISFTLFIRLSDLDEDLKGTVVNQGCKRQLNFKMKLQGQTYIKGKDQFTLFRNKCGSIRCRFVFKSEYEDRSSDTSATALTA